MDLNKIDNNELLSIVKAKVNSFLTENDTNNKCSFLDNITYYAKEIKFENTIDILLPLFKKINNEQDNVKIKFLNNISSFSELINGFGGYQIIKEQLLPIVASFFNYKSNLKVVDHACDAFISMSNLIKEEDKGSHVLNTVICKYFIIQYLLMMMMKNVEL